MSKARQPGLEKAVETVRALRAEGGCPWDRAQTHASLRPYLLEETYEVLEALDGMPGKEASAHLKEELGDLLLQVLLHSQIASEEGRFSIDEVAEGLAEKLVRRHPHVFGGPSLGTAEQVVNAWEKAKQEEKPRESVLDGVPRALPALQRSLKVIEKVSKAGFQWENLEGPLEKVKEELGEFLDEVKKLGEPGAVGRETPIPENVKAKLEAELGDLIFTLSNVAYFLRLNPEDALRSMLARFETRFRHVEKRARESGKKLEEMKLEEMDRFWNEAKKL